MNEYPAVAKRLTKWGLLPHLHLAYDTVVDAQTAVLYVRAIVPTITTVRVKRTRGSWHHKRQSIITLSCNAARQVRLLDCLHEAAHAKKYRGFAKSDPSHGEAFCRTYARILREVME